LKTRLHADRRHIYILDGDNVRHKLNRDLGFTETDRVENIRRVAKVTRLLIDAGLMWSSRLFRHYRAERQFARNLFDPGVSLKSSWIRRSHNTNAVM
jgi:bifunctional enzyme CysN/CysC